MGRQHGGGTGQPGPLPPVLEITSPVEDSEQSYLHDIAGSATDPNLMGYALELRRVGDVHPVKALARIKHSYERP